MSDRYACSLLATDEDRAYHSLIYFDADNEAFARTMANYIAAQKYPDHDGFVGRHVLVIRVDDEPHYELEIDPDTLKQYGAIE